jgi:hypothetical protein
MGRIETIGGHALFDEGDHGMCHSSDPIICLSDQPY